MLYDGSAQCLPSRREEPGTESHKKNKDITVVENHETPGRLLNTIPPFPEELPNVHRIIIHAPRTKEKRSRVGRVPVDSLVELDSRARDKSTVRGSHDLIIRAHVGYSYQELGRVAFVGCCSRLGRGAKDIIKAIQYGFGIAGNS